MNNRPEWFSPKRFGYGAGLPCSWQGWALLLAYMVVMIGSAVGFADEQPLIFASIALPATLLFVLVAAKTTKGGFRWRWGNRD